MGKEEIERLLLKHREEVKDYIRKKRRDKGVQRASYKNILPERYRAMISSGNSQRKRVEITLDEYNRLVSLPCVFCGTESKVGIDRIDSNEGYVNGNVHPCCGNCNMMKHTKTNDFFISQVKKIYEFLFKK